MKLLKKKKQEEISLTHEQWDIMREFRKAPFKERFLQIESLVNS